MFSLQGLWLRYLDTGKEALSHQLENSATPPPQSFRLCLVTDPFTWKTHLIFFSQNKTRMFKNSLFAFRTGEWCLQDAWRQSVVTTSSYAANQHGCQGAARRAPSPTSDSTGRRPFLLRPPLPAWAANHSASGTPAKPPRCWWSPVLVTHLQDRAPCGLNAPGALPRGAC